MERFLNTRQKHIDIYKELIGIKSGFVLTSVDGKTVRLWLKNLASHQGKAL